MSKGGGVIGVAALLALSVGCGGSEQGKSYLIRHASVSLAQAASLAERQVPGRAVKVELLYTGKHVVYEVQVLDTGNQLKTVAIDAETGKVVK
ncbi:PepSY domain-containing protein [Nitrospira moscoviensis]|uniref:PepSY domain-containing protein n=1 Tax=Nitrospira moscoviensis TaxID=42253 RepID=A0A0K2GDF8_NITMO|nr:PepSY domain-containing protein [Nitrospira moscoviensis]ALA58985.1 exported protein of unknown function [Nitrospira moscoviensis]